MSCASGLMPNIIKTNKVTQWNKKKKLDAEHTNLSSKHKINIYQILALVTPSIPLVCFGISKKKKHEIL